MKACLPTNQCTVPENTKLLQDKKACLINDINIASEILRTEIPLEAKHRGKEVKDFNLDQWKEGLVVVETGITVTE